MGETPTLWMNERLNSMSCVSKDTAGQALSQVPSIRLLSKAKQNEITLVPGGCTDTDTRRFSKLSLITLSSWSPPPPHSSATTQRELRRAQCGQGLVRSAWDLTVSWHLFLQASDKEDLSVSCSRQDSHCSISGRTGTSLTQAQVPIF